MPYTKKKRNLDDMAGHVMNNSAAAKENLVGAPECGRGVGNALSLGRGLESQSLEVGVVTNLAHYAKYPQSYPQTGILNL